MSTNPFIEQKVDRLEEAIIMLSKEIIDHKNESRKFFEQYKEENRLALEKDKEENRESFEQYKKENREFLEQYAKENRDEHRKLNQEWGYLSNKMGTIVEDIISPATRPLIARYYDIDINYIDIYVNVSKMSVKGDRSQFDVIAVTWDKVFFIEVKSTMRDTYIKQLKDKLVNFFDFFPEYSTKELIPVIASLSIEPNSVNQLTKNGILAMAYREWDYMDFLNFKERNRTKK